MITWPDIEPDLGMAGANLPRARIVLVTLAVILAIVAVESPGPVLGATRHPPGRPHPSLLLPVVPAMGAGFWAGMLYVRWLAHLRIPDGRAAAGPAAPRTLVQAGSVGGFIVVAIGAEAFLFRSLAAHPL